MARATKASGGEAFGPLQGRQAGFADSYPTIPPSRSHVWGRGLGARNTTPAGVRGWVTIRPFLIRARPVPGQRVPFPSTVDRRPHPEGQGPVGAVVHDGVHEDGAVLGVGDGVPDHEGPVPRHGVRPQRGREPWA